MRALHRGAVSHPFSRFLLLSLCACSHPGLASAHATISALQLELTTQREINKELNDTVTETLDWMHELETGCEAAIKVAKRQGNGDGSGDAQRASANDANAPAGQHMQTGL